jgi:hypothetical protein
MQVQQPERCSVLQRRTINPAEVAVLRAVLLRAPTEPDSTTLLTGIEALEVVERCPCGCDTVRFAVSVDAARERPIADGVGLTPAGGRVGVIVLGTADAIHELEVYDLGAGDNDLRLPVPDSIRSWDDAAAV